MDWPVVLSVSKMGSSHQRSFMLTERKARQEGRGKNFCPCGSLTGRGRVPLPDQKGAQGPSGSTSFHRRGKKDIEQVTCRLFSEKKRGGEHRP